MPVVCNVIRWSGYLGLTEVLEGGVDGETLWLHGNRFPASQVSTRRLNVLPRSHVNEFTELLANFDLLASVDVELKVFRSFKDKDDGATQAESTHLLSRFQGLPIQEGRSCGVHCFTVCTWRRKFSSFVRSEVLQR
jgi:hypothetical protein